MADFHVYRDRLEIRLTRAEKLLSLRRDDLVVPRESIRSVAITADPWIWIRGVRAPGNSIPLTLAVGTWKFHGGKDFLVLKGKQRSAVVIDIDQPNPDDADAAPTEAVSSEAVSSEASSDAGPSDGAPSESGRTEAPADAAQQPDEAAAGGEVADGFSRVIVSTQHASKLVEALRDIRPGSDAPVDKVIG